MPSISSRTAESTLERLAEPGGWKGTHICFYQKPAPERKTCVWVVFSNNNLPLGQVRWHGRWRKYCFYPLGDCIFEEMCLREISRFIVERTRDHRRKLSEAA